MPLRRPGDAITRSGARMSTSSAVPLLVGTCAAARAAARHVRVAGELRERRDLTRIGQRQQILVGAEIERDDALRRHRARGCGAVVLIAALPHRIIGRRRSE